MHILDYRNPANPAHYSVGEIKVGEGGLTAQIAVAHPLRGDGPSNGYTFPCEIPAIDLGTDPKAAVVDWLVSPAGPFTGCPVVSDADLAVEGKRLALLTRSKARRDALQSGIAPTPFGPVDIDPASQIKLMAVGKMFELAEKYGQPVAAFEFTMADDSEPAFTQTQFEQMLLATFQYSASVHNHRRQLKKAITAATTLAELEAIDVETGWPE